MPRVARRTALGVTHHVMARGIERRIIFADDLDRVALLDRLSRVLEASGVVCFAWAFMPNHFHLVVRSETVPISRWMARIATGHALAFNRRHDRVGHLFQNRFRSRVVGDDADLVGLVRYVHLNPLVGGVVQTLAELATHPWCGHAGLLGRVRPASFHATAETLGLFGDEPDRARAQMLAWMREGWERGLPMEALEPDAPLRSEPSAMSEPAEGWEALVRAVCRRFELHPEALRPTTRAAHASRARAVLAHLGVQRLGLAVCDVAALLGMTRGAASRAVVRGAPLAARLIGPPTDRAGAAFPATNVPSATSATSVPSATRPRQ
jgi:REP element-mobilizing transposase RayT